MAGYISKKAVVRYLKGYSEKELNKNGSYGMITSSVLNKAERAISEIPAADVQPVKHGRWIKVIGENYECSNCKAALWVRKVNPISNYKYCWSCGYKMDGDNDGKD